MIKNNTHILLRHSLACERVVNKIDENPHALKGLSIPPREIIVNDNNQLIKYGAFGMFLAFLIKVFHS